MLSVEEGSCDESVTGPIHGLHVEVMELFALENLVLDLLFPSFPVLLLRVDVVVEDGVDCWEHRLDLTNDLVKLLPALLIDSGADRPNDREDEPLLHVGMVVFYSHVCLC